jgi:lysophospholipase L1-like esterase
MTNTIVCIGDSITNGSFLTKNLTNQLSEKYPDLSIVNLGIGGQTEAQMDARKTGADIYNPFRVIVWGGINGISSGYSTSAIESSLQSMYTYYHNKGYEVWALTITPRNDDSSAYNLIRNTVNNWIKNSATGLSKVIDAWAIISNPSDTTQINPIYNYPGSVNHPNELGLSKVVEKL